MTINSEYGLVTPVRRPITPINKPGLPLDSATTPKPPYVDNPIVPPKPVPGVPVKPPFPDSPIPVPKPPVNGAAVPPKPPALDNPIAMPKPPVGGSNIPAKPPFTETGTGKPPVTVPPGTQGQPPGTPGSLGLDFMRQVTPNELVANQLQGLLDSNSPYIQNARRRGLEQANARGMLNSSIAAGNSQRSALEAAMPIAMADADVYRQANQGNFESLSQLRQMRTAAELEDWLGSQTYNREFNGTLAMMPIQSAMDMLTYIQQRGLEDPSVYTPEVMSGINNFFNQNMFDILGRYFNTAGPGGG